MTIGGLRRGAATLLAGAALLLPGCHPDYTRGLPGGYRLVRANAEEVVIEDPSGGVVITPKIVGLGRSGDVVFGVTERPTALFAKGWDVVPGHFFLDAGTGALVMGLGERAWRDSLAAHGVTTPPTLHEPTRFGGGL